MTNTQRQKSNAPSSRPLRIFLSHASEDKPRVLQIDEWLKTFGTQPWLDKTELTGGDQWEQRIKTEMRRSDLIIICLSELAINKRGYFQVEITDALALAQREPEGFTLIIPVFLEMCTLPERLRSFHTVSLYEPSGTHNLVRALNKRANELPGVFFNTPQVIPGLIIEPTQALAPMPASIDNPTIIEHIVFPPFPSTGTSSVPLQNTPGPAYPNTIYPQIQKISPPKLEPEDEDKSTRREFIIKLLVGAGILAAGGTATTLVIRSCSAPSGTTITFAASSEKYKWLQDAIRTFQTKHQNITITLQEDGSLNQKQAWLNSSPPTIWSPASQIDVDLFSAEWLQKHRTEDIVPLGSLVSSPLIFAIWQQYANALISKYKSISFASLYDALQISGGWASPTFGKNNWGGITFTHTRSDTSNSGLSTLLLIADAYAQSLKKPLTISLILSQDFSTYLKVFEDKATSGWQAFPYSSGSSATYFDDTDPDGIQNHSGYNIVMTYENLFLSKMMKNPQSTLSIFYPQRDIISNHPFILFKDASADQRTAAHDFYTYLISSEQQRNAVTYGFRPSSHGVNFLDSSIHRNPFINQPWSSSIDSSIKDTFGRQETSLLNELIRSWQSLYRKYS